jgi:hypothetical protein
MPVDLEKKICLAQNVTEDTAKPLLQFDGLKTLAVPTM